MDENYLKRSDEKLGRMVRETAQRFKDSRGFTASMCMTGAQLLISSALDINAAETTLTLEGFTDKTGEECGDWRVTVLRTSPPGGKKECPFNHELHQDKDDACPVCGEPFNPDF